MVTPLAATTVIDVGDELKTVEFMTTELLSKFAYAICVVRFAFYSTEEWSEV